MSEEMVLKVTLEISSQLFPRDQCDASSYITCFLMTYFISSYEQLCIILSLEKQFNN